MGWLLGWKPWLPTTFFISLCSSILFYCGSLRNQKRTVHEIIGGGFAADAILWRHKNINRTMLITTIASWLVFEKFGYTLLSLVSSVLLLLITILFLWAKSAAILNRPAPPLPELHLSEELVKEAASFIHTHVNYLLSAFQDIAMAKDSRLFFKVAACLLLVSIVGAFTDLLTLIYTCLIIVLTIPAAYERYENEIDKYVLLTYSKLLHLGELSFQKLQNVYAEVAEKSGAKYREWTLEKRKLS